MSNSCKGRTVAGQKCRNNAIDATGFCKLHHPDVRKRPPTGAQFEESVVKILRLLGYTVRHDVIMAGCQIDIFAEIRTGVIPLRLMVECKDYGPDHAVGVEEVKEFSGVLYPVRGSGVDKGLLVARSGFTRAAKQLADSTGIHLVEFSELANQLLDFDDYIQRVIREFDESQVAKYYVDLSYALTEDYLGEEPGALQRPLDDAVNRILFDEDKTRLLRSRSPPLPSASVDQEQASKLAENIAAEPKALKKDKGGATQRRKPDNMLSKSRLALLGNFGTGKTTWCKKYARDLALQYKRDHTCRIPVVVSLSDYETKLDIQQLVTNTLQFRYGIRADLSICQELQRLGRFLFIFDGLDEMATRVDPEVVRENLREINKIARIQENAFIVTCRTHFFRDRVQAEVLGDFEIVFIPEWGETELQEYLQKRFGPEWEKQLDRIHGTHNLTELAQTPLFLEMITETLPKLGEQVRRAELYETYTNAWIIEQSKRRGARLQSDDRKNFVIELATKLYRDNRPSCHYTEFSGMLQKRFSVNDAGQIDYLQTDVRNCTFLTRNTSGDYEFRHKSFTEYFVAVAIKDQLDAGSAELFSLKPLPVEVRGFLIELLSASPPRDLLVQWNRLERGSVLRDNAFALAVGLQVQVSDTTKPIQAAETGDDDLVLNFLQGDAAAFGEMVRRYLPGVQSRLLKMGLDQSLSREAAYDVFLTILQNRERIGSPKEFLPYLARAAKWKAADIKRREVRHANRNVSFDDLREELLDISDGSYDFSPEELWDHNRSPDEELINKEDSTAREEQFAGLESAMTQLDEVKQTVIRRSLFEGASAAEIAKQRGISISKFYKVRREAIAQLRRLLARSQNSAT